jgi:hypothetical protein
LDWHACSWLVHPNRHDELAVALLVVVAAVDGGVPGTMHADWHVAYPELQLIMQFVTVEVCATRVLPAAHAPVANPPKTNTANRTFKARMSNLPNSSTPGILTCLGPARNAGITQREVRTPCLIPQTTH